MNSGPAPIYGYDAADDYSASRSLLLFPENSRQELHCGVRRKLQLKARALEANFFFLTRIRGKIGRAVAGTGIFPTPITTDAAWNVQAKELFERWAGNPLTYAIDGSRDLWEDQRLCAEEIGAGDGEFFTLLVKQKGEFYTQALDPFEIESPWRAQGSWKAQPEPQRYEDGIRTDPYGRPIAYSVAELPASGDYRARAWRDVPAADMIHVLRRRRARQARGIPPLYSGLNDGHDALDLLAFEKATAKLHSVLAVTKSGKLAGAGRGVGAQIERVLNADGSTLRLEEHFPRGAATVELGDGEQLDLKTSQRPAMAVIEGVKAFCHFMSMSGDLPVSVLLSFSGVGGTAVRADLEDAQDSFDQRQDQVVWRHSQPIYVRRLALAQERGELPRCQDPFWWRSAWQGPRKLTVDYGRSADANISLMKSGMMAVPSYYEERGKDALVEMRKQVDWIVEAQNYCAARGVDFSRFIEATPGAVPAGESGKQESRKPEEDDEE